MPPDIKYVSRETNGRLRVYHDHLLKWQGKINLISPNTVKDAWRRHFLDSAQLLAYLPKEGCRLYDLGSGAGFPGLVLTIARPDVEVTLIESDTKKCAFLKNVSRETEATVKIENCRIERAAQSLRPPDIITARALAPLSDLLALIEPWSASNADLTVIFLKGAAWQQEVDAAQSAGWVFDLEAFPSETDENSRILQLKNIRKTDR